MSPQIDATRKRSAKAACSGCTHPGVPVAVISGALVRIAQYLVGLAGLFELSSAAWLPGLRSGWN